jgi:hypothetical protein
MTRRFPSSLSQPREALHEDMAHTKQESCHRWCESCVLWSIFPLAYVSKIFSGGQITYTLGKKKKDVTVEYDIWAQGTW